MPTRGGYFIGNVSPARMDFRWFALGNCIAILSSLATHEQSMAIMDLIEARCEELVDDIHGTYIHHLGGLHWPGPGR
ncbi:alkalineneutral invertase f [Populus alba x Populus x berolinensis]|nr:alkalineneutral invertase f [Populus alba x Populus x berolinensis]